MSTKYSVRFAAIIGVSLVVTGCGNNDAEIKQYAKKHGMSEIQSAAFMACTRDMKGKKPAFPVAEGNMVMKSVPLDVCACQVKTMTSVFKDNQYKSYGAFAAYMAKEVKKKPPRLNKKDLQPDLKPAGARQQLETSLTSCVTTYKDAHAEQNAELFEIVPLKLVKQKANKTAAAGS